VTRRPKPRREIFECPHCGADVPTGSKVCRECGSDAGTGWQAGEEIDYQGVEIPDGYGPDEQPGPSGRTRTWVVVTAIVVAAALAFLVARGRW
jgi:hypothetical protein